MAEDFMTKFNRLLGDRAGIPMSRPRIPVNTYANQNIASKMGNKNYGKTSKGTGANGPGSRLPKRRPKPKMTEDQKALQAMLKQGFARQATEDAIGKRLKDSNDNAFLSGVGKVTDILVGRPFYSVMEPIRAISEAANNGENPLEAVDNAAKGFMNALIGRKKTGFGDVVEENADRAPHSSWASNIPLLNVGEGLNSYKDDTNQISPMLDKILNFGIKPPTGGPHLREAGPITYAGAAHGAKVVLGAEGDLALDPFNLASGSTTTILRATGEAATEGRIMQLIGETAERIAKDKLPAGTRAITIPGEIVSTTKDVTKEIADLTVRKAVLEKSIADAGQVTGSSVGKTAEEIADLQPRANKLRRQIKYADYDPELTLTPDEMPVRGSPGMEPDIASNPNSYHRQVMDRVAAKKAAWEAELADIEEQIAKGPQSAPKPTGGKKGPPKPNLAAQQDSLARVTRRLQELIEVNGTQVEQQLGNTFQAPHVSVGHAAADSAAKSTLSIEGGAQAGKTFTGRIIPVVTNAAAEQYRHVRLSAFEKALQKFAGHVDKSAELTMKQIKKLFELPEMRVFRDDLIEHINAARPKNPIGNNWEDLMKALDARKNPNIDSLLKRSADTARASIGDEVASFMDEFAAGIGDLTYNAPGIRILDHSIPFKRVGLAYADLKGALGKHISGDLASKLSYGRLFPGRLAILSMKAKSMGIKPYEELLDEVKVMAKGISPEERKILSRALDNGTALTDPKLEIARMWIRAQYDKIFDLEVQMGVRTPGQRIDNYQFVFNRRGSVGARAAFKKTRKTLATETRSFAGHTVQDAAKQGFKPIDDAFDALLYRKADSNRSLTRAWFKEDLLDHYGLMAPKLSTTEQIRRGLQPMNKDKLSEKILSGMGKADEWYLPKEMNTVLDEFEKLTHLGSKEGIILTRIFDNLMNKFKFMSTVLYPGFHLRNMMGDIFMGYLDGVRSHTYTELINKARISRKGEKTSFRIGNNLELTYDELNDLYMTHAAGGRFHASDLTTEGLGSAPRRIADKMRDFSEAREDLGRLAHFLHALREEYPAAVRAGKKDALEKATEAATFRVNKYKFDYSALTATEHQIKRFGIPFYTYTRKAIPTLMEALFLSPRNMGRAHRLFTQHQGQNYDNFNHMLVPQYMREAGYATLKDENEPWSISGDILPYPGAFSKIDVSSTQEFMKSLVSMANPILAAPAELSAGQYAFNDRPIKSNKEYIMSKIRPVTAVQQLLQSPNSNSEQVVSGAIGGGLPIKKISTGQQEFAFQALRQKIIDKPFRDFNKKFQSSGIKVSMSSRNEGTSFQVRDTVTNQIIFETMNPQEAISYAEKAAKLLIEERGPIKEAPQFDRTMLNGMDLRSKNQLAGS